MILYAFGGDIGHGRRGTGASGKIDEAACNWNVGQYVKEGCDLHGIPFKILREQDENPTLAERAERAREWGADFLISIHHNAGGGVGFEIYKSTMPLSGEFASLLAKEYGTLGRKAHGAGVAIKTMNNGSNWYGIIREADARGTPSVITEFAYVDSKDAEAVDTLREQKDEAKAIVRAMCKLCDIKFVDW